jgi:hypothetical protein
MGETKVKNAIVVGHVEAIHEFQKANATHFKTVYGIITPRTEGFLIDGVNFVNFNSDSVKQATTDAHAQKFYAMSTCSHCGMMSTWDSGARTVKIGSVTWTNSTSYVHFNTPRRAILRDLDGTFT